ncbi:MAG: hypothetical protein ACRECY_17835 [Phyllobacterium sp.]
MFDPSPILISKKAFVLLAIVAVVIMAGAWAAGRVFIPVEREAEPPGRQGQTAAPVATYADQS